VRTSDENWTEFLFKKRKLVGFSHKTQIWFSGFLDVAVSLLGYAIRFWLVVRLMVRFERGCDTS
jgi:hypothetical protein